MNQHLLMTSRTGRRTAGRHGGGRRSSGEGLRRVRLLLSPRGAFGGEGLRLAHEVRAQLVEQLEALIKQRVRLGTRGRAKEGAGEGGSGGGVTKETVAAMSRGR